MLGRFASASHLTATIFEKWRSNWAKIWRTTSNYQVKSRLQSIVVQIITSRSLFSVGPTLKTTENVVAGLKLHQAYDFLETMKKIVEEDHGHRAKAILEAYPQLIPACVEIQRRLGMVNIAVAADHKSTSLSVIESINTVPTISQSSYQQHLLQQVGNNG